MSHRPRSALQSVDFDTDDSVPVQLDVNYDDGLGVLGRRGVWSSKGPSVDDTSRLSVLATLYLHVRWAWSGLADAARCKRALNLVQASRELRVGLLKGLALSGAVCVVIYTFVSLLPRPSLPEEDHFWPDMSGERRASAAPSWFSSPHHVFWLYPVMAASYFIASTWCVGVAEAAFTAHHIQPLRPPAEHVWWCEYAVRAMLIVNYSIPCLLLQNLPWVGHVLSFLVMSFVDGFFCFEQVWSVRGWPLEKRLRFAESHWSFLMGFGVPSTLVSFFHPSGLLNLMLFMLVFPICTLLAFLAVPQPHSAALGAQTAMLPSTVHGAGNAQNTPLAWCLPARIPLFWPTVRFRRWVSTRMATEMPPLIPRKPMSAPSADPRRSVSTMAPSMSPATPRRSAASFVGGAWSMHPRGRMVSAPLAGSPDHVAEPPSSWRASAVSIPMSSETLGPRKMPKQAS